MTAQGSDDRRASRLPGWSSVLVVVAHPDDESFGLGAVIDTFVRSGSIVAVLCLTHGEASTLHGVAGNLAEVRKKELHDAADALGVLSVHLLDMADGAVEDVPVHVIVEQIVRVARDERADGLLVFDPGGITGHPDHRAATAAAVVAADELLIGVLAWTLPEPVAATLHEEFGVDFIGTRDVDVELPVDRGRQRAAVMCHPSQAVPGSALWRRLELQGSVEYLRWLVTPDSIEPSHS